MLEYRAARALVPHDPHNAPLQERMARCEKDRFVFGAARRDRAVRDHRAATAKAKHRAGLDHQTRSTRNENGAVDDVLAA